MRAIGLDPALGGGCAFVCADMGEKLTVIDAYTEDGLTKTEQIFSIVEDFAKRYRPNLLIVEFDAQQKGIGNDDRLAALSFLYGFTIRPHITRNKKVDQMFGVAAMDQSFRKGDIRIPYGDDDTIRKMTPFIHQLKAWRPDIKTKHLTQDLVMALWFVWLRWMELQKAHTEDAKPAWRPSFLYQERRGA